ncbi:MAG: M23 family metallopeptidase [Bacteroidales bacterium]|jgi:murein DD-endopeptidase MepM/ murein hydrolase activator NlpD|nr:M23 family metallopeptidase [Bacteroidales bacterium]
MSLFDKIKEGSRKYYRFVIMNNATFEEKLVFKLTPLSVFTASMITVVILIILSISLVAFTPLREYIPGYGSAAQNRKIAQLQAKTDSLTEMLTAIAVYEKDVKRVLLGEKFVEDTSSEVINTTRKEPTFTMTAYDSLLLSLTENLPSSAGHAQPQMLKSKEGKASGLFFPPVKGQAEQQGRNQGVAIACKQGTSVYASAAGTVIYAGYDAEEGTSLIIHHPHNTLTFYRHAGTPLVSAGDVVQAKQIVAITDVDQMVYFELWIDGNSVNPENYMLF